MSTSTRKTLPYERKCYGRAFIAHTGEISNKMQEQWSQRSASYEKTNSIEKGRILPLCVRAFQLQFLI